jgi:hypothetical protein
MLSEIKNTKALINASQQDTLINKIKDKFNFADFKSLAYILIAGTILCFAIFDFNTFIMIFDAIKNLK